MNTEKFSVKWGLGLLIIASVSLPSGLFLGAPIKHFAFIAALSIILYHWVRDAARIPNGLILISVWSFSFVSFFAILGATNDHVRPDDAIQEAIGVFTTIAVVLMALASTRLGWVSSKQVVAFCLYGAFIFSLIKNSIAILMASGAIGFYHALDFYMVNFNAKFVSSAIFGGLVRVNFIIYDFFVLLMLSVCLIYPEAVSKVNSKVRFIYIISAFVCIFFAFSRYLFGVLAVIFVYAYIFKFDLIKKSLFALFIVPLLIYQADWIEGAFEQRFIAQQNVDSDEKRGDQVDALIGHWSESPVIGHGLGAFAPDLIRDQRVPYSYEVQWAGFLLKMGIVGVGFLIFLAILAFREVHREIGVVAALPLALLLLFFLLGGLTNQYLITSGSGVYYMAILCVSQVARERVRGL